MNVSTFALLCSLAAAPDPGPEALGRVVDQAAQKALSDVSVGKQVGLYVRGPTPELVEAAQSLLVDALRRRGARAALVIAGADGAMAEQHAREQGMDLLVRATVAIEAGEVTLAGDRIGTWVNFWDGLTVIRQYPGMSLSARAPADGPAYTLAHLPLPTTPPVTPQPAAPLKLAMEPLFRLPGKVLALALVDADGDGKPEIAALGASDLWVLKASGEVLFRRDLSSFPEAAHPSRDPWARLVAPDGPTGHKLQYAVSTRARGELLGLDKQGFHALNLLDGAPLAVTPAGVLWSQPVAGTPLLSPELHLGTQAVATLERPLLGLRVSPTGGDAPYLAVWAEGQAQLYGPTFAPVGAPLPAVGEAWLADLDGDGQPEVIASSALVGAPTDAVRVLKLGQVVPLFTQDNLAGAVSAGCAGDLDGDGRLEVILAVLPPEGGTVLYRLGDRQGGKP